MPSPQVLLVGPSDSLRDFLAPHFSTGEVPSDAPTIPESAAAVVVNVIDIRAAARQTRLWRADLVGQPVPIVWVLPDASAAAFGAGFDAGADVCLGAPVEPAVLVAQIRAAARQRAAAAKLAAQAADARTLNEQLRRAYEQLDAGGRFADTVLRSLLPPRPPDFGAVRLSVASGAHGRAAGNIYHAARVGPHHVGVLVADLGAANLGAFAPLVRLVAAGSEWTAGGPRVVPPVEVLTRVNQALVGLGLDPPALVGLTYAVIDWWAGRAEVARGGLPPAVHVPVDAEVPPAAWVGPAPFLGAFEAEFLAVGGDLRAGDRIILHTAGRDEYIIEAATKYRGRSGQGFADPVAREGLAPFPGTVVVVEFAGERDPRA